MSAGNVLMIGKLEGVFSDVKSLLSEKFRVMNVEAEPSMINSMYSVLSPEVVFVNMRQSDNVMTALNCLDDLSCNVPVVGMISASDEAKYAHYADILDIQFYIDSEVDDTFILATCEIMGKDPSVLKRTKADGEKSVVLIIDDSPLFLRKIKGMLDGTYEVLGATSGEAGIKALKKKYVDLILLDYEMPDMNGKETLVEIKKDNELKDIPVIFLTGVTDKKHILEVLELKPDGYILKGTDDNKILEKIKSIIGD